MSEPTTISLSAAGRTRRIAMLVDLQATMTRHHQKRRRISRTVAGATVAVSATIAATQLASHTPVIPSSALIDQTVTVRPAAHIVWVETDPAIEEHLGIKVVLGAHTFLDDGELLDFLDEINRPSGLIRIGSRVRLTAKVTDAEQPREEPPVSPPV